MLMSRPTWLAMKPGAMIEVTAERLPNTAKQTMDNSLADMKQCDYINKNTEMSADGADMLNKKVVKLNVLQFRARAGEEELQHAQEQLQTERASPRSRQETTREGDAQLTMPDAAISVAAFDGQPLEVAVETRAELTQAMTLNVSDRLIKQTADLQQARRDDTAILEIMEAKFMVRIIDLDDRPIDFERKMRDMGKQFVQAVSWARTTNIQLTQRIDNSEQDSLESCNDVEREGIAAEPTCFLLAEHMAAC